MSEAPERIWVKTRGVPKYYEFPCEDLPLLVEYVRADRIEELEAKLAKAREEGFWAGRSCGGAKKEIDAALAELKGQDDGNDT